MAPTTPRLRILSVGGNAISAFLSWRLQATNACDVTLVWKSQYDTVAQYGISMKSALLGNERFKPHGVIQSTEEASATPRAPFDYVLLCVKALPDMYDLAKIIESVVSPQHTCILLNTTTTLGMEEYLSQRFPTNVVLSLVCGADLHQLGASEFEHRGDSADIWVGWANKNSRIPESIQKDMAAALAMTLTTGSVNCNVATNIRQQQFERVIGPIAFHTTSVIFECPGHAELLQLTGVRDLVVNVIDELLALARAHGCEFAPDFREKTIETMIRPSPDQSIMYQDFIARRPMEVETFLGSPMKMAREVGASVPRIETLYTLLHHKNTTNLNKPAGPPVSPGYKPPPPRSSSVAGTGPRPIPNGGPMMNGNGRRAPSHNMPPGMRRGGPHSNGYPPRSNGYANGFPPEGGPRRPSMEGDDLGEFSHLVLYDNAPDGGFPESGNGVYAEGGPQPSSSNLGNLSYRERELELRRQEIELQKQQMYLNSQRRPPPPQQRRPPPATGGWEDDEDGDDYFDPMANSNGPPAAAMDENFDMLSITSRRTRKSSGNVNQSRQSDGGGYRGGRGMFSRAKQHRTSTRLMQDMPGLHDQIMNNPLMGYSSNRYGSVDRQAMGEQSRQNSLTSERLNEFSRGPGSYQGYPATGPVQRRQSQSPGNPLSPPMKRPSPPNGYMNGVPNGRPSPPGMRQPVPRHPPGHGNAVAPQQVEQHAGVSNIYPQKQSPQVRSLTGSASASAGSGDSSGASALLDSSNSSANSSLGPRARPAIRT